ncbi:MAG: TIGR04282 family arsenosugar biosynthesis glycosyltransferase [Altibacter sp.]|uniref:TIGR04282 family arsenosugar biosynthesis glycosyltransferase n=1 Tax=Altibacter sp. TaxID=2024823 RepID=UPI001D4BA3EB|nr:TIGR04282 family arsenosugar biosynthesis glycosyltransferase [Altibacter sp.]MBZ0326766.1 TIGR04282 family arsenosugar biosynthesis glycosyltransferase [Altibacter sp.]
MGLLSNKNTNGAEDLAFDFHFPTSKRALLIFTRNPELGRCKTRLAKVIGDENALAVYTVLLKHTAAITRPVDADKFVYYSEKIHTNDIWDDAVFRKKLQRGDDLGARMENAFTEIFASGYNEVVIIGSDMYDLRTPDLQNAFLQLEKHDVVIGPAEDGGYYLLGMKCLEQKVFSNKNWGTNSVLKATLHDLKNDLVFKLPLRNDIDVYEDLRDIEVFQPYLNQIINTTA